MTRLLTSTLLLAALVSAAPAFAAGAQPKSVAVRPTLVAPEIVITGYRDRPQSNSSAQASTKREKDDRIVATNDQRPRS